MSKRRFRTFLVGTASLLALPAAAQTAPTSQIPPTSDAAIGDSQTAANAETPTAGSGEIVVTALKGASKLRETPATVLVLQPLQLSERGITSITDLKTQVPGFTFSTGPYSGTALLRGVGTATAVQSFDPAVGLFFDGIFAARGRDFSSSLFDVGSIQVVKGTQAVVLGKNTSVGGVVVTSRRPTFDTSFNALASYDFALGSTNVEVGADLPVSDTLSFRVAARRSDRKGWTKNDFTGFYGPETDSKDARVSALFKPSDETSVYTYFQFNDVAVKGYPFETATPGNTIARFGPYDPYGLIDTTLNYHAQTADSHWLRSDFSNAFRSYRGFLEIAQKLGDFSLTSTTGFHASANYDNYLDTDSSILPADVSFPYVKSRTFSSELRLESPRSAPLRFQVGALYYYNKFLNDVKTYSFEPTFPCTTAGVYCGATDEYFNQDTRTGSAFGQAQFDASTWLQLTGGLRYTHERKKVFNSLSYIIGVKSPDGKITYPSPNATLVARAPLSPLTEFDRSEGNIDYSLNALFRATPRLNFYVSYGKGSKSGGFQSQSRSVLGALPYNTEIARTSEAGFKWDFRDGHIYGAAFNMNIKGFQDAAFNGTRFTLQQYPARSRGFELDALVSPLEGLDLSVQGTYADAKRRDTNVALTRAPKLTGIANVTYATDLSENYRVRINANAFYSDPYSLSFIAFVPRQAKSSTKLGLTLGLDNKQQGWSVGLFARNLNNVKTINFASPHAATLSNAPPNFATMASLDEPRTVGIQLRIER